MSLRLVIEHSTHPQPLREMRHLGGDLSIGRGRECDWPLDDPDMFVSRKHCVISVRDGQYLVTDASRGGLFVDGSDRPLGPGNTATLDNGTRLRMGDVVFRVEILTPPVPGTATPHDDDFFSRPVEASVSPPRPTTLPEPFDTGRPATTGPAAPPPRPAGPPAFDDPFTLDPIHTPAAPPPSRAPAFSAEEFWPDAPAESADPARKPRAEPAADPADFGFDSFAGPAAKRAPSTTLAAARPVVPEPAPERPEAAPVRAVPPAPAVTPEQTTAVLAAFLRGAGVDDIAHGLTGSHEDMEQLGHRFRLLAEGLFQLLRARAKEKGSARLAQTVIGSVDVNPLKFLPTADEALAALIAPRGRGYLAPDEAISGAFRDITDHQMRSWIAIQSALRRMIDRFDPAAFEAEIDKAGIMRALLAGGRGARLWQLYAERYREIARSAEDRFLGEVGADFRDAYEGNRRTQDD